MSTIELTLSRVLGRDCGCTKRRVKLQRWLRGFWQWLHTFFMTIETLWIRDGGTWKQVFDISTPDPCEDAPTISSHTMADINTAVDCATQDWVTESNVSIAGSMGTFQIERQLAWGITSNPTNWTTVSTNTVTNTPGQQAGRFAGEYFDDFGFNDVNLFMRWRARIVTDVGAPCSDWDTASQLEIQRKSCLD
jgi:hypothetical protein